ncbi:flavin reductase family protein [Paraburkholderia oxyphila]|uniref:flavin reductase family protein n=1 Tax=Paraburkholderia oxyphila TaxID=614212 RepID=UPI000694BC13|nr:flavin reductase family protein [Paraburkholderia oxyphila]
MQLETQDCTLPVVCGTPATPDAFRAGMRRLAGGVCVLTSELDGLPVGLTATAVTSLCAEPPRLLACVNRKVFAHAAFERTRTLCVNVLAAEDTPVAMRFAGMVPNVSGAERFAEREWQGTPPMLAGALASFACRVVEIVAAHSHSILICEVERIAMRETAAAPLVYAQGQFGHFSSIN